MRLRAAVIGCIAIALTLSPIGSSMAQADDASFVHEVKSLGFLPTTNNLISIARSACYFLSRNRDPGQVEERILRYTRVETRDQAHQFFVLAVREYCPQYAGVVGP